MKSFRTFALFIFVLIILEYKSSPNLKDKSKIIYRKNAKSNSAQKEKHTKEYYDKLVERGILLDNLTNVNPSPPFYGKINIKKEKKRRLDFSKELKNYRKLRKLSDTQTLENLGFLDLYQNGDSNKVLYALRFLMSKIKKEESKFILYPYSFNYFENGVQKDVQKGGFFTLNQTMLDGGNFAYLQNISSVEIGKAKGLYDIDIAILSIVYDYKGRETDLFTEASLYCNYFVTTLNKMNTCLQGKEEYLNYKISFPNRGSIVRISDKDILNETLFDPKTNQLKFKLLIISDYLTGNEDTILEKYITSNAINIISKFRELGGHIIASGKSGYLLEKMGLIESDIYDNSFTLHTNEENNIQTISGCETIFKETPDENNDFFKQLICYGYKEKTYLLQAFTLKKIPNNFESLIDYTNTNGKIYKKTIEGEMIDISDTTAKFNYILTSKEEGEKGRIMIVNGNPIQQTGYIENVRNMVFYAMSKNLIYDLKIQFSLTDSEEDLPIPAGEEGVQLVSVYKIYNLDDTDITDIEVNILLANEIEIIQNPTGCNVEIDDKYSQLNVSSIDNTKYIKCIISKIDKLKSISNQFKIEITNYRITAQLNDIPLLYSNLTYKDSKGKILVNTPGVYYAQAEIAAVLRGTINKDPSSTYPIEGYGRYFDLVLNVENKENTVANNVSYISLVPLVTPLFDGEDEGAVAKLCRLYENYYEDHDYTYPWIDPYNKEEDYIDYAEIAGKGIVYVDDFDTPTKIARRSREELQAKGTIKNIYNYTEGNITLDEKAGSDKNANSLLKQIYFGDNEKFYETATSRTSLFIDTATEEGAKALYGERSENIPDDLVDPYYPNRTKTHYCFIRLDTFFYPSSHGLYQYPTGLDDKILLSIDRYDQSSITKGGSKIGDRRAKLLIPGHYNSTRNRYDRLKPNEYSNVMREYAFMQRYDPTDNDDLERLKALTNNSVRLTHFMVPFTDKEKIQKAGSLLGFKESNKGDGSGYLEQYPSVKFVYGHSIEVILPPEITRLGGIVEISLGEVRFDDDDPVKEDRITTSADNVAFFKTLYNSTNNKVILYFRRGLMPNENYGLPSKCKVFLENLQLRMDFNITLDIFELKYDFSQKNLEYYNHITNATKIINANYIPFFSLPCLYIENKVSRKASFDEEESGTIFEYELVNPFARYGGYYQELTTHTTVWASAEAHHRVRPGFQAINSGFSVLHNVGTSAIPFAEFLNHGKLAIPGAISTTRLEWTDIWGRMWAQNLRSCYPDIPVIPPGPLSYIMTTTFELITNDNKQERVIEWTSDESVYIYIQMKIKNTYNLYWEPTICLKNQRPFMKKSYSDYRNPVFIDFNEDLSDVKDDHEINLGFSSVYGICYDENSYIGGRKLNSDLISKMNIMMSCSSTEDALEMSKCSRKADEWGLPLVKKRPENVTDNDDNTPNHNWNYSPLIESYYPKGYIYSNKMWQLDMGKPDYYDDSFWKGYPFHMDDCIPNFDNSINKPHDLIAFPIFKGLGYNITYSPEYSIKKFPKYKGWWSDQLQNKDHTLLAGQEKVNRYSVNETSLLKDSDWINYKKLNYSTKDGQKTNLANYRARNIYVCQYNQNRVKVKPNQPRYTFLKNVYQNNVVPVLPDLAEDDERYTNFKCEGENSYQYTPYNISKVDNRVYTGNDRDWLYFAAGLRADAYENINVILKLDPMKNNLYEGITKIQDGGRFTYWVPPDGPNSYLYYDGNVNTVIAKRIDLSIEQSIFPLQLYTFNTYAFQLFNIEDKREENREYTMNTYMNSHGYGDATTTVYVGGTEATSCKVNPGEFTYVKITFYNNAGFDWKMKDNGITLDEAGYSLFLNAASLMSGKATAIQFPKEYKFMSYKIPAEIEPYVTLSPSQHVIDVSPQFFDLTFNNVLNIKDAFEGDYFYCLNVSDAFPDNLRGKFWEIKMELNEEYFETLPGKNDPTGLHNYHITIPSIRFGVPIKEGIYAGKIFYNLGQATDLVFTFKLHKNFQLQGLKIVDNETITEMHNATQDNKNKFVLLNKIWNETEDNELVKNITIKNETLSDGFFQLVTINLTKAFPLFPYEQELKPFASKISLIMRTYADYIPYGYKNLFRDSTIKYNDGRKNKSNTDYSRIYTSATGPSIRPEFGDVIVAKNESDSSLFYETEEQTIYEGDKKYIKLTVKAINEGNQDAYNVKMNLGINPNMEYIPRNMASSLTCVDNGIVDGQRIIAVEYKGAVIHGDFIKFDLYFEVRFESKLDILRNIEENKKELTMVKGVDISLCLSNVECVKGDENYGRQLMDDISHKISFQLETEDKEEIESKEKKSNDGFPLYAIIIIAAIALAVIAGGSFLVYKYLLKKENPIALENETFKNNEKGFNSKVGKKRSIKNVPKSSVIKFVEQ